MMACERRFAVVDRPNRRCSSMCDPDHASAKSFLFDEIQQCSFKVGSGYERPAWRQSTHLCSRPMVSLGGRTIVQFDNSAARASSLCKLSRSGCANHQRKADATSPPLWNRSAEETTMHCRFPSRSASAIASPARLSTSSDRTLPPSAEMITSQFPKASCKHFGDRGSPPTARSPRAGKASRGANQGRYGMSATQRLLDKRNSSPTRGAKYKQPHHVTARSSALLILKRPNECDRFREPLLKELDECPKLRIGIAFIQRLHRLPQRRVNIHQLRHSLRNGGCQDAPAIGRIALALDEASFLETIEQGGYRACRKAGELGDLAGAGWSAHLQNVQTFQIRGVEPDHAPDRVAHDNSLSAGSAKRLGESADEFRAIS